MRRSFPPPTSIVQRRVVVTGMGLVSPLANGVYNTWKKLLEGKSGVRSLQEGDPHYPIENISSYPTSLAATVPRGSGDGLFDESKWPRLPRFVQYAMEATNEAFQMSGWTASTLNKTNTSINPGYNHNSSEHHNIYNAERSGVVIGTGIGCLESTIQAVETIREKGNRRLSPHFVPSVLLNMAAGHVSIMHGLQGPNTSPSTACATGAHAIGEAYRYIKFGEADMMVAGGTEASINSLSLGGFGKMRALSTKWNNTPENASRPFDKDRDGFVLGEGAAVIIMEDMDTAVKRGANILCEIRGCGVSGDATHLTAPHVNGDGAYRAMQSAIQQSGLCASDVMYVNAHATSTPLGDNAEACAIDKVFGNRSSLLVSSTKGATGHLLGAAGSLEAIFSILAMQTSTVPHTLNLDNPDVSTSFTHVRGEPLHKHIDVCMSNSFGFGGTNASLIFSKM